MFIVQKSNEVVMTNEAIPLFRPAQKEKLWIILIQRGLEWDWASEQKSKIELSAAVAVLMQYHVPYSTHHHERKYLCFLVSTDEFAVSPKFLFYTERIQQPLCIRGKWKFS